MRFPARRLAPVLLGLVLLAPARVSAQEPHAASVPDSVALHPGGWDLSGRLGLALAQSSFTSNWRGGDNGSFAWTLRGEFTGERQYSRSFNWRNSLLVAYGQTAQQVRSTGTDVRTWEEPQKSTDQLAFASLARWTNQKALQPYIAFQAESYFRDESSPIGTIRWNPIRLKESAGLAHVFEKSETREFITRFGVGARQTIAKSFVEPPTTRTENVFANDGGFEWETTFKRPIMEDRVVVRSRLLVFEALLYSKSDDLKTFDENVTVIDPTHTEVQGYWRVPDVDWSTAFSTQITKVVSVDLFLQLIYDKFDTAANVDNSLDLDTVLRPEIDKNVRLAGQFKQTLAIGISYTLF